jgi:hypothetical protein
MSIHIRLLPETEEQYQELIEKSQKHFGDPLLIPELDTRERVEHSFSRDLGGVTLTVFLPDTNRKIRLLSKPYIYYCQREAKLENKYGTLYALISLLPGEVRDISQNHAGLPCTHAVCVFFPDPKDKPRFEQPRFYLVPPRK